MQIVTPNTMQQAMSRALFVLQNDSKVVACSESAGFAVVGGAGRKRGYQIFVEVARYSDAVLKKDPSTAGLLKNVKKTV